MFVSRCATVLAIDMMDQDMRHHPGVKMAGMWIHVRTMSPRPKTKQAVTAEEKNLQTAD